MVELVAGDRADFLMPSLELDPCPLTHACNPLGFVESRFAVLATSHEPGCIVNLRIGSSFCDRSPI